MAGRGKMLRGVAASLFDKTRMYEVFDGIENLHRLMGSVGIAAE
jgi:hypothetical protein